MLEIRWHGRGGQGVVTAARILAAAALRDGKYFQAFPEFGPERRGAPLQAFTRIDEKPVRVFSQVTNPQVVVVLDSTLLGKVCVADGLTDDGIVVANFGGTPAELKKLLDLNGQKVFVVNATDIAVRNLGRPITNTPMVGALLKASGVLALDVVEAQLRETFAKLKGDLVTRNVAALKEAYEEVRGE